MASQGTPAQGGRRGLVATAIAVVFMLSGAGFIATSLASQRGIPHVARRADTRAPLLAVLTAAQSWMSIPSPSPEVMGPVLERSKPVSLDIPSIEVHSAVRSLGQTTKGALEVPAPGPHYDEAAWYRHSPTPGSLGPAILLGHVDSATDGPSVFFRLGELRKGDLISITRADDSVAVFIVDGVHSYAKDDFPTELVYGDINHAGLRVVTCGGAFDDAAGHYLDNVVVFASLRNP